jgi:uncharacterized membrane protein
MKEGRAARHALVSLILIYAVARVLQIFPTKIPTLPIVLLHVVPPAIFAWIHGRSTLGTRGILIFMALCLGTGSFFESLSLRVGFPFGHYMFTGVMGPKVIQLPVLLALAWVGVGYLAWVLARLIVGAEHGSRRERFLVPSIAAVLMGSWDLAMDPVWTNIDRAWIWFDGGGYFGVPFSNYFGWLLTAWIFYQAFGLWAGGQPESTATPAWNRLAVLMFGVTAAGNLLLAVPSALPAGYPKTITDAAGRHWLTSDLIGACILITVFIMLPFVVIAWNRAASDAGLGRESPTRSSADAMRAG